jgi:hypothetical protein
MSKRNSRPSRRLKLDTSRGDHGPKERWRHDPVALEPLADSSDPRARRARVYSRNPLETYFRRQVIDHKQKLAGEVLGRLWQSAALEPRVIGRYEEYVDTVRFTGGQVRRTEAYERWRAAVAAVGPIAADEVIAVCCAEEPVKGTARVEILRRKLEVLAKHFGV